jgi:hypothetical protein
MTGSEGPAPRTVAVFGSCITRDNFNSRFNPDHRRWYRVVAEANQSSVIALMSPPVDPQVTEADGLSDYDAWNVRSDLSRAFLDEVVAAQPDYLILDFFGDLHFGVLQLPDGRYVTANRWKLHKTAQYARWQEQGGTTTFRALVDPEGYFALWTEALDRFAAHLAAHCPDTTVIVHRGFYADRVVTGPSGRPQSLRTFANLAKLKVRKVNEFWARLDDYAVSTHGWSSIDLRAERYTSTAEHPWGAFWVHYTLDYYPRFLAELHEIDLGLRSDPAVREQVALIGAASRERILEQVAFVRSALRAERRQVDELESRGALRSLRDAVARRKQARR